MPTDTLHIPDAIAKRMAAREAEILGHPPRLAPLADDELDDEAREWVRANSASFGNSTDGPPKISDTFRTFFRNFPLFRAQMLVYVQLLVKNMLSNRERELIIMRMLWRCNAPNPYGEHVKMARQIGMSDAEIVGILEGPDAPVWVDAHDRAVLRAVDQVYERQAMDDATWAELMTVWTDKQMLEFIACSTQYFGSGCQHNVLRTRPSPGNAAYREIGA